MTSETRDEFRKRLRGAFRQGRMRDGSASLWKTQRGRDSDGVEAVYAQAVRDLLADIEREFEPSLGDWVRSWAWERWIETEGSGDE